VKAQDAPRLIERMLKGYLGNRASRGETFLAFSRRHEVENLKSIFAVEAVE
jgi:ferredoxin-nitrite reductase